MKAILFVLGVVFCLTVDIVLMALAAGALTVGQIAKIMRALVHALAIHLLRSTIFQISNRPDDPATQRAADTEGVVMEIVATREEWDALRGASHKAGIHLSNVRWTPFGVTQKFIYTFYAQNDDPEAAQRKRNR